ncbi:MAG: hypothetical protein M1281_15970 [Chloroflexi bacterium]|nr:hypothetical protein [Chloroflexota bacterium]
MDEKESIKTEANSVFRPHRSMSGVLRWMLVVLLAFGLGALLVAFTLYFPTRQKLDKAITDLGTANASITSQTDQIKTLQTGNETLQKDLDAVSLQMYVLKALSGVRGASLAVVANDYAGARLSLIQASEALNTLSGLPDTSQKDVFTAMQQNATQALTDVQTSNLKSAQPELDQLTKNLTQLEANLSTNNP